MHVPRETCFRIAIPTTKKQTNQKHMSTQHTFSKIRIAVATKQNGAIYQSSLLEQKIYTNHQALTRCSNYVSTQREQNKHLIRTQKTKKVTNYHTHHSVEIHAFTANDLTKTGNIDCMNR
jgi:hypothetical protein